MGTKIVSIAVARTYPGFGAALRSFKRFHKAAPRHFTVANIADGTSKVTKRAVMMVGESPALEYQTIPGQRSNKAGQHGRRIVWRHKLGEEGGKRPLMVHDPKSGITSLIGGTYKLDSWYRR